MLNRAQTFVSSLLRSALQMRTAKETQEEYEECSDLSWKLEVTKRLQLKLVRELGYRGRKNEVPICGIHELYSQESDIIVMCC